MFFRTLPHLFCLKGCKFIEQRIFTYFSYSSFCFRPSFMKNLECHNITMFSFHQMNLGKFSFLIYWSWLIELIVTKLKANKCENEQVHIQVLPFDLFDFITSNLEENQNVVSLLIGVIFLSNFLDWSLINFPYAYISCPFQWSLLTNG